MTKQDDEKKEKKEYTHYCEVCKSKYGHENAQIQKFCCDHKLTPIEVLYRSDPSPSGP